MFFYAARNVFIVRKYSCQFHFTGVAQILTFLLEGKEKDSEYSFLFFLTRTAPHLASPWGQ